MLRPRCPNVTRLRPALLLAPMLRGCATCPVHVVPDPGEYAVISTHDHEGAPWSQATVDVTEDVVILTYVDDGASWVLTFDVIGNWYLVPGAYETTGACTADTGGDTGHDTGPQ